MVMMTHNIGTLLLLRVADRIILRFAVIGVKNKLEQAEIRPNEVTQYPTLNPRQVPWCRIKAIHILKFYSKGNSLDDKINHLLSWFV